MLGKDDFPILFQFVFDTLFCPVMSVEYERVFSSIKKLIIFKRNYLKEVEGGGGPRLALGVEEHCLTGPLGIWKLGFAVNAAELVTVNLGSSRNELDLMKKLLAANAYQLFVSFLYMFHNNILTRQLVADEWTRFLRPEGKKPLRVSSPVGMQRSSYMLSLPDDLLGSHDDIIHSTSLSDLA